jgi:predicted membrane-bound spermidine synthase
MARTSRDAFAFLAGVFLLCMSVLMIQIIQTRILSVVSLYYMAFFSISMAMLGLTGGALIVYYKLDHVNPGNVNAFLSRISTAFALCIAACFIFELASPLPSLEWATYAVLWLKAIVLLAAPFTIGGIAVSLALTRSGVPIGITYGVDLLGAATGCLASLALLTWMDASSAMFMTAALAAVAAWCFGRAASEPVPASPVLNWRIFGKPGFVAVYLAALAGINASTDAGFQPIVVKFGRLDQLSSISHIKWNSFSRIVASQPTVVPPFLWGASPATPRSGMVEHRELTIDGMAGTWMPRYSDAPGNLDFLRYDVTNLAYYARHSGRSAVIGVGSGRDILSAHLFGFRDITGVELNPIFIDLLTDPAKLRAYAGIADLPGVRFVVDDGRSWFARTQEKFDLIEMSMVDTWAATGAGAFSLSENGLYTVEGWKAFLSALKPNGLFTVSRWHSPRSTVELGRVVSLAVATLMELGAERPSDHIFVAGVGNLATAIVSRAPFARSDLQVLQDAADKLRFTVLASPDRPATDTVIVDMLTARDLQDLNTRAARHFLDVSPPTDARPFFFNQLRFTHPNDIFFALREWRDGETLDSGSGWSGNLIAVGTLFLVILLSAIVVAYVVILPTRSAVRQVDRQLALVGSGYFLLIGLGFMFAEIGLIQRISVFLGHPVYALSIGLFSIILSTGLGSLLSERLTPSRTGHFVFWLGLLAGYLVLLPLWLPDLLQSSLATATLPWRALTSVAVIFPAGLLMGFGFPTGMRLISRLDARLTPWLWGVNGASGVLAAGIAVACSIGFSIDVTIRVGGACYAILLLFALLLQRMQRQKRSAVNQQATVASNPT